MGVILNDSPELYKSVTAAVPFVDVITTMLDESIPLTTGEYDEWGNPNKKEFYDYILSYSPYDNIKEQDYPNILVTAGYHDSQVQFWEPAKWVAKMRKMKKIIIYCFWSLIWMLDTAVHLEDLIILKKLQRSMLLYCN